MSDDYVKFEPISREAAEQVPRRTPKNKWQHVLEALKSGQAVSIKAPTPEEANIMSRSLGRTATSQAWMLDLEYRYGGGKLVVIPLGAYKSPPPKARTPGNGRRKRKGSQPDETAEG